MPYKVLLLDDDEKFRKVVLFGLREKNIEVTEATNGAEAFALAENSSFDLLIIDGILPDTDGINWIRQYRSEDGRQPVIFISSQWQSVETYNMLTRELQVAQIIHKPVIPSVFAEQIYAEVSRPYWATKPAQREEQDPSMEALSKEYLSQLPEELNEIKNALNKISQQGLADEELKTMRLYSHKIRGTAGTFGFDELGQHMAEMEDSIKTHQSAAGIDDSNFVKQLKSFFEKAKITLRNYEHTEETETTPTPEFKSLSCILVADTDPVFLSSVEKVARQRFVDVLSAASPQEVLRLLSSKTIDAIIIDARMAESRSCEFIKTIRDLTGENVPIAFISEETNLEERLLAPHLGASLYLSKPIDPDRLEDAIQRLTFLGSRVRPKVLIVDDDHSFARRISAVLNANGMDVKINAEPAQILEVLQEFNPDILLLDLMMPYISGFDICKMLRTMPRWQALPVLFVTAQTGLQTRLAAFACGADDYLPKPLADEELIARVSLRIERSRLLKDRNERDAVTGLLLRRSFMERFNAAISSARRTSQPLSLVLFDLDKFKAVNDEHGHLAGDSVLAGLGRLMLRRFRAEDLRGRWGGDEFVLALLGSDRQQSIKLMQNFIEEFASNEFTGEKGEAFKVTLSAGIASYPLDFDCSYELLRVADMRLYEAKGMGRNRVVADTPVSIES